MDRIVHLISARTRDRLSTVQTSASRVPVRAAPVSAAEPIAIITRDDVVHRILSHLNLPAAPAPIGPGGSLGWDLGDERMDDWAVGMDPEPPDVDVTQRGPPCDACVHPPAPDC